MNRSAAASPAPGRPPGSERGLALLARKVRSAYRLITYRGGRAATRVLNLAMKRQRHYSARLKRARHVLAFKSRDAVLTASNLSRLAGRRILALRKPVIRLMKRRERAQQVAAAIRVERRVERRVNRIAATRGPIVLGPWLSEVGFEVLYWIPFLHWLKAQHNWDSRRLVAISRGGVASWYHGLADTYLEIFDHIDPDAFARRNESRREAGEGSHKQMVVSELDRELIDHAMRSAGLRGAEVIHPSSMYLLFRNYWLGHRGVSHVEERTRVERRKPPEKFDLSSLPREYIAVKAYTAASLPDNARNRRMLQAIVARLAARTPVVTLDTGLMLDDHADYEIDRGHGIFNLSSLLTPANNLELQTQVIAGARAFVGTCGSLTWLAPLLGVNTVALLSDARFLHPHLYFARKVYLQAGAASFATVDLNAFDHVGIDLPPVATPPPLGV